MDTEPQLVCKIANKESGLNAYLVIDSTISNRSCGGVRIAEDISVDEVKALARAMTLKYGFLNCFYHFPMGGAKAGIVMPANCSIPERQEILWAFGQQLAPMLRNDIYIPWTDLNSSTEDMGIIRGAAGLEPTTYNDSPYYTALTVLASITAACHFRGLSLSGMTVAIEGFGNVGTCLAQELVGLGVKIVALSNLMGAIYDENGLDINALVRSRNDKGDDFILDYQTSVGMKKEELLTLEVDVLVPCARTWAINENNADNIKAKVIVPSANRPITDTAAKILRHKNILSVPDFVSNIGGAYGSLLEQSGIRKENTRSLLFDGFSFLVAMLLQKSSERECSPEFLATEIALKEIARLRSGFIGAENNSGTSRHIPGRIASIFFKNNQIPRRIVETRIFNSAKKKLSESAQLLGG